MESFGPLPQGVFRLSPPKGAAAPGFPFGLGRRGVHEIALARYGDGPAAIGFALGALPPEMWGVVFWILPHQQQFDAGRPFYSQLRAMRPSLSVLTGKVGRLRDALWATEEAVRSAAVSLVIAEIADLDFTASRRLTLASQRHGVPVLLLMSHAREGATAADARWRLSSLPSAENPFDPQAPGNPRWQAVLERSRVVPELAGQRFELEYDRETHCLDMVDGLAARSAAPYTSRRPLRERPAAGLFRHTG
jgi:protein ImuA